MKVDKTEMQSVKKQIANIEKEWGGPEILDKMQESEIVSTHVVNLIELKQVEDPFVFNTLYNPKKNRQAIKLDHHQLKKKHKEI